MLIYSFLIAASLCPVSMCFRAIMGKVVSKGEKWPTTKASLPVLLPLKIPHTIAIFAT